MADSHLAVTEAYCPETDGKPMAEADVHWDQMVDLIHALREWFRGDPEVYVTGNLLMYYDEGDPKASVAPDVFMMRGVEDYQRRTYKLWEEGKGPDLVIEVTSKSTKSEDLRRKKTLYADLGVREYFIFDPLSEWLTPTLVLHRLTRGEYVPVEAGTDRVPSKVTGLEFGVVDSRLRMFDPATGAMLPTADEEAEARREAEARAEDLEQEVERLRRQLADRGSDG